jgi:hypothetical protein
MNYLSRGGIYLTFFILFPILTSAQSGNTLEFGSGLLLQSNRNHLISPLRYTGSAIPVSAGYRRDKPKYSITIESLFSDKRLQSGFSSGYNHTQKDLDARLRIGYLRNIASFGTGKGMFIIGAYHDVMVNLQKQYYDPDHIEHFIDISASLVDIASGFRYQLSSDHIFNEIFDISILNLGLRSPYFGLRRDLDTYFEFPDQFFKITEKFSYQYRFSRVIKLRVLYLFTYYRYKHPFLNRSLYQNVLIQFGVRI